MNLQTNIVLRDYATSQLAYDVIHNVNHVIINNINTNINLFFQNITMPCIKPMCGLFCVNELHNAKDLIITTDIDTTLLAAKMVVQANKIFYVNDIEWIRRNQNDYLYNLAAYRDNTILIARSQSHAQALTQYANKIIKYIIPIFDLKQIYEIYTNEYILAL